MTEKEVVFVFGSNEAGRHGAGSALEALKNHGAVYGVGRGRQGNSYAIPTKTRHLSRLCLSDIQSEVDTFIQYAKAHSDTTFRVVDVGCGLAGYTPELIAPMFKGAPGNCHFTVGFERILDRL